MLWTEQMLITIIDYVQSTEMTFAVSNKHSATATDADVYVSRTLQLL